MLLHCELFLSKDMMKFSAGFPKKILGRKSTGRKAGREWVWTPADKEVFYSICIHFRFTAQLPEEALKMEVKSSRVSGSRWVLA
jgi:hypothetical protein